MLVLHILRANCPKFAGDAMTTSLTDAFLAAHLSAASSRENK